MQCLMHSVCHEIRFSVMFFLWVCAAMFLFMYLFMNFLDFAVEALIKKQNKISSYIWKFRVEQLQSQV
jgi:hypothetical protein